MASHIISRSFTKTMVFRSFIQTTTLQPNLKKIESEDMIVDPMHKAVSSSVDTGNSDVWYVPFLVGTETDHNNYSDTTKGHDIPFIKHNGKD